MATLDNLIIRNIGHKNTYDMTIKNLHFYNKAVKLMVLDSIGNVKGVQLGAHCVLLP